MNIIIAGAGELGRLLASELAAFSHDIVMIDSSAEILEHIGEKLDVRVLEGSCTALSILKEAGIREADAFLALSGDDEANMVACQLAFNYGVKKTICRLNTPGRFDAEDGIEPASFGIWKVIEPHEECIRKVLGVLKNRSVMEEIRFSNADALITVLEIRRVSFLAGTRIKDIPTDSGLLASIRFAAIVRENSLIFPHGDTLLVPGDKVYIAGHEKNVNAFLQWAAPDDALPDGARILIAGASSAGTGLAANLARRGYDVRFIEKDRDLGEKLLEEVNSGLLVLQGDPTKEEVLEEGGVKNARAFIGCTNDDESNILSCLLAGRMGAEKAVAVTFKPEYIRIVPSMPQIHCGFSSTLAAANSILRILSSRTARVDAFLQLFGASLAEFKVTKASPLSKMTLAQAKLPPTIVLAIIFRGEEVMAPSGNTALEVGDTVVAITTQETGKLLSRYFPEK